MKTRFIRSLPILAGMAWISFLSTPSPARADLEIQLSLDNVTFTPVGTSPSGGLATFNATFDGFAISASGTSNSPGTSTFSEVVGSTLQVTNNNAGTANIFIRIGDTGFMAPTTPPNITMDSHIGGSVSNLGNAAANLLTFQSYADTGNGQDSATGISPGAQTPPVNLLGGSYSNDAVTTITSLTAPFSMTQTYALTLGAGAQIGWQANTTLSAVPEPAPIALALTGLPVLGLLWARRRPRA